MINWNVYANKLRGEGMRLLGKIEATNHKNALIKAQNKYKKYIEIRVESTNNKTDIIVYI